MPTIALAIVALLAAMVPLSATEPAPEHPDLGHLRLNQVQVIGTHNSYKPVSYTHLEGIPPAPRGMPQIEVEFNIDANGILQVTATEKKTGKSADIKITNSGGLSEEEIDKMKRDAEMHAEEDKKRRELVETKNRGDQMVHQIRQQLEEHGEKVSSDIRGNIESAISNLEEKLKTDDKEAIEAASKQLETVAMELGKAIYEAQGADGGAASQAEPKDAAENDDDVIDAEFKVKDEDK